MTRYIVYFSTTTDGDVQHYNRFVDIDEKKGLGSLNKYFEENWTGYDCQITSTTKKDAHIITRGEDGGYTWEIDGKVIVETKNLITYEGGSSELPLHAFTGIDREALDDLKNRYWRDSINYKFIHTLAPTTCEYFVAWQASGEHPHGEIMELVPAKIMEQLNTILGEKHPEQEVNISFISKLT